MLLSDFNKMSVSIKLQGLHMFIPYIFQMTQWYLKFYKDSMNHKKPNIHFLARFLTENQK